MSAYFRFYLCGREAAEWLIDMRLLERLPYETGRDYALRIIKYNIICTELAPGSAVSENQLSAELGLSRTPVREALIELSKVKIVEITPQKRSVIALIDYDMVDESRFMRNVLECAVVELVCEMATSEDILQLEENIRLQKFYSENHFSELLNLDNQFHEILFKIARKPQVHAQIQNISVHFDRVRSLSLLTVKSLKIVQDHEDIVSAIADHDAKAARQLMETHLNRYKIDAKEIKEKYPQYFAKI